MNDVRPEREKRIDLKTGQIGKGNIIHIRYLNIQRRDGRNKVTRDVRNRADGYID